MTGRETLTAFVEQPARERTGCRFRCSRCTPNRVASQQQLRRVPQLPIQDRLMQPRMADALVTNLANVNGIREQRVERSPKERVSARAFSVPCDSDFGSDTASIQIF